MNRKPTMYSFIHFKPGQFFNAYREVDGIHNQHRVLVISIDSQDSNFNHYKLLIDGFIVPCRQRFVYERQFYVLSDEKLPSSYKGNWFLFDGVLSIKK